MTLTPGHIMYRDISCLYSTKQILECTCHNTQKFEFDVEPSLSNTNDSDVQPVLSNIYEKCQAQTSDGINLKIRDITGQWCAIKYDDNIYPRTISEISETHAKVKCMHKARQITSSGQRVKMGICDSYLCAGQVFAS